VGAFPNANPIEWKGIAELSNAYVEIPIDLRANLHATDAVTFYKSPRGPAALVAMATKPFKVMLQFVQYPLWIVEPAPDSLPGRPATRVTLMDLRFGTPSAPGFAAFATINARDQVLDSFFSFGGPR
jgi:hypothetical protein